MGKIKDITGMVFGKLTAIKFTQIKHNKAFWLCECECGNKVERMGKYLRKRKSCSCGECSKYQYEFYDDHVIGYSNDGASFMIDLDDYEKVKDHLWSQSGNKKYLRNFKLGAMHRFLTIRREFS